MNLPNKNSFRHVSKWAQMLRTVQIQRLFEASIQAKAAISTQAEVWGFLCDEEHAVASKIDFLGTRTIQPAGPSPYSGGKVANTDPPARSIASHITQLVGKLV